MATETDVAVETFDLATTPRRELNARLHALAGESEPQPAHWRVVNPSGAHALAVGLDAPVTVEIEGHVGYYCAGMNKQAAVRVHGNAGVGVAENMMSGTVIVEGSVGHMSAFMAQKGALVVCGDAGDALGDSIYEAHLYVRGAVKGLGADCVEKELKDHHVAELRALLERAGVDDADPADFRRYGSARRLYNFNVDHAGEY